jgi:hypothetical protein
MLTSRELISLKEPRLVPIQQKIICNFLNLKKYRFK